MRGRGHIHVVHDERTGRARLASGESEPPFSIRACGGRILVAASAAAPVGGDELCLDVVVGRGAWADVGAVASTIVLPGPTGAVSSMTTHCTVAEGAHLDWVGEPTVSVAGSDHTVTTTIVLDRTASCRVVEEVSLGRTGEPSGALRLVVRVERGGEPVVHHVERFGPDVAGAGSSVSVAGARHVLSAVLVGVDAGGPRVDADDDATTRVAWLPLADDAVLVLAVGPTRPDVSAAVARLAPELAERRRR